MGKIIKKDSIFECEEHFVYYIDDMWIDEEGKVQFILEQCGSNLGSSRFKYVNIDKIKSDYRQLK